MPVQSTTFTPLQWKNGINPKSQGSFQTFMKQLADWANAMQNQVTRFSNVGSFAGWAFYTGSAPSVTSTPASITNWVMGTSSGLSVTLTGGTTFSVPGITMMTFQGTSPADGLAYTANLNSLSGSGAGGVICSGSIAHPVAFSGLQSQGSFTIQTSVTLGTGSLSNCSLGILMFNL